MVNFKYNFEKYKIGNFILKSIFNPLIHSSAYFRQLELITFLQLRQFWQVLAWSRSRMKKYARKSGFYFPNLFKGFLAVELVAVVGSYLVWNRMNNSRQFRKSMFDNFPSILEGYYSLGEKLDSSNNIRELDSRFWKNEKDHS